MKTPKFGQEDKVFAKVRGYPPWPARIDGLADETPNKMRYHVFFYGTGETAVVKAEDICSFVENKAKLGKPKKHKGFTEALREIEDLLSHEDRIRLKELTAISEQSKIVQEDLNTSTNSDKTEISTTPKGGNRRASTANKQIGNKQTPLTGNKQPLSPSLASKPKLEKKKRKAEPETSVASTGHTEDQPEQKKQKTMTPLATTLSVQSSSQSESPEKLPEVMSRSGRKIKPKRFADFDEAPNEETQQPISNKLPKPTSKLGKIPEGEDFLVALKDGEKIQIPLKLNRPQFDSIKAATEWDESVLKFANSLKKRIESGDFTESINTLMDSWTKRKVANLSTQNQTSPTKFARKEWEEKMEILKIENQLTTIDIHIREALRLKKADTKKCFELLDTLSKLPFTSIMLKKHPSLVNTIRKMRRYIGNKAVWQMSESETKAFNITSLKIRIKADSIYKKFKSIFLIPLDKPFFQQFVKELLEFGKKTKHLSKKEIYLITDSRPVQ